MHVTAIFAIFLLFSFLHTSNARRPWAPVYIGNWTSLPTLPVELSESQGALVPHKKPAQNLLVITGGVRPFTGFAALNHTYSLSVTKRDAWKRMADMPEEITHAAHAVAGRIYYHCGGYIGKHPGGTSNRCYGFDIDNNKWFSIPDLPGERAGGAMFYIESMNSLLYSGGARRSRPGLRDAVDFEDSWMLYLDDLERGWVVKAPLPNPRNHIAGICVRGRYFFIGGQHGEDERRGNQASTEEYIPSEDKWVTRADMPLNLGHFTSAAVAHQNGIVIVAGSTRFITLVDEVMYYHIGSDTWHVLGTYPRLAKSVVCGSRRGTVYCATGQGSRGVPQDDGWYIKLSKFRTRVAM